MRDRSLRLPVGRAALLLAATLFACANPRPASPLRVGVATDYAPFASRAGDGEIVGLDADLIRAFAASHGRRVTFVPFAWPTLTDDLRAGRFDLAAGGLTVRPERSVAGRFSVPLLETGAVLLTTAPRGIDSAEAANAPGVRIAVNRGGHLERVARALFPRADLRAIPDNAAVREALARGEVDAALTDSVEAPLWERGLAGAKRIGPLTRDVKAFWMAPGEAALARDLDRWLLEREADGTLAAVRARWLAEPGEREATPARALAAAIAERVALMPLVAEAKRAAKLPVLASAREAQVVAAATARGREAYAARGVARPPDADVAAFFEALLAAARAEQERVLSQPAPPVAPAYSLDAELRPALDRLTDRIAFLLAALPRDTDAGALAADLARLSPALAAAPASAREISERAAALAR